MVSIRFSLYMRLLTIKGVKPVYVQAVWKLKIPPRVQMFLWLLSKNKLLTRNNLAKRRELDDLTCLFCSETITIHHLFFYCCVAKCMWSALADILGLSGNWDYECVASLWVPNKKFMLANIVNVAALWCLWKVRNKICFQGDVWIAMKKVLTWISRTFRRWKPMLNAVMEEELELVIQKITELEANRPPGISWSPLNSQASVFQPLVADCITVNQQISEFVIQSNTAVTSGLSLAGAPLRF